MTGAAQHRVGCPHLESHEAELCMASKVSPSNAAHFPRENRVVGVDAATLRRYAERAAESDATVVVCNACRRVLRVDGSDVTVLEEGAPW